MKLRFFLLLGLLWVSAAGAYEIIWQTNYVPARLTVDAQSNLVVNGTAIILPQGYYPSNTFSIFAATNGLNEGDFRLMNSNSVPVLVLISNGAPVILRF